MQRQIGNDEYSKSSDNIINSATCIEWIFDGLDMKYHKLLMESKFSQPDTKQI